MSGYKVENDVPKYRKIKPSGVSKAIKKSRHVHKYERCVVNIIGSGTMLWEAKRCRVCGKLRMEKGIYHVEQTDYGRRYSKAEKPEIYEKYRNVPLYRIKDFFQDVVRDDERSSLDIVFQKS